MFKMTWAKLIVTVAFGVGLSACGGGGSGDVVVPVKNVPLSVSASTAVSLQAGTTTTYKINGGGSGSSFVHYSVSSSNESAATASVNSDVITVSGKAAGSGKIVITDSASNSVSFDFAVTAASPLPFKVNAPAQVKVSAGGTMSFDIVGGVLPYSTASSNQAVVSSSVSGSKVLINGVTQGTSNIVVFDAIGSSFPVSVLVGDDQKPSTALYSTSPTNLTLNNGKTVNYLVGGGATPYAVSASNPTVIAASISGNSLSISSTAAGSSDVIVTDANGANLKVAVQVSDVTPVALFTTAPVSLIMTPNSSASYSVKGGTPPYSASSGNISALTSSVAGETLRIDALAAGTGNVVIFDSTGKSVSITVVVNTGITQFYMTAPALVNFKTGQVETYQLYGGKAPYTAVSGNTSVATVSVNGSDLTVTGKAVGTASILIRDSLGSIINSNVIVN